MIKLPTARQAIAEIAAVTGEPVHHVRRYARALREADRRLWPHGEATLEAVNCRNLACLLIAVATREAASEAATIVAGYYDLRHERVSLHGKYGNKAHLGPLLRDGPGKAQTLGLHLTRLLQGLRENRLGIFADRLRLVLQMTPTRQARLILSNGSDRSDDDVEVNHYRVAKRGQATEGSAVERQVIVQPKLFVALVEL